MQRPGMSCACQDSSLNDGSVGQRKIRVGEIEIRANEVNGAAKNERAEA